MYNDIHRALVMDFDWRVQDPADNLGGGGKGFGINNYKLEKAPSTYTRPREIGVL